MDIAIVTGADSRFGDSVIRTLLKMGFRVHAIGPNPDVSGYDERYVVGHSCGPGKLAELKGSLDEILREEGRLDLLVGIGGPEVTTGWEESTPEALVRRLHGCLTEPLLAANICIPALRASKGFLIHGHRRPVTHDLEVSAGYFEDSLRRAYDDLFIRNAASGLRSARILYAYPDSDSEGSPVYQDIAESVSKAFEIILRQKETCVIREMSISPRGLKPASSFPNLVPEMDPYQNTALPPLEEKEVDPILIPTEKPRHYVQIAELKDVTNGEEDPEADAAWEPDTEEKPEGGGKRRKPPRKRSRRRKNSPGEASAPDDSSPAQSTESDGAKKDSPDKPEASEDAGGSEKPPAKKTPRPRKKPRKRTARSSDDTTDKKEAGPSKPEEGKGE